MITIGTVSERSAPGVVELLDSTPMMGAVRLATHRPAGLIPSLRAEGRRRDVLIGSENSEQHIIGVGIRSEKECYVDRKPEPQCVGYLSALRVREGYRRGVWLGRGYRALRRLHQKGKAPYYLTTVLADNLEAIRLLTSGRAGLPIYKDWGEFRPS